MVGVGGSSPLATTKLVINFFLVASGRERSSKILLGAKSDVRKHGPYDSRDGGGRLRQEQAVEGEGQDVRSSPLATTNLFFLSCTMIKQRRSSATCRADD